MVFYCGISQRGACPMAWPMVYKPMKLGGLGIRILHILNGALRMKWLWVCHTNVDKPWAFDRIPCSGKARMLF
jgi:hypothetical protein